jgi:Mg/Co/Ni transporter MgtE
MTYFNLAASDGASRLTVNAVDVTEHVQRVVVDVEGIGVPQVTVFTRMPGTITGDGVVTVVSEPQATDVLAAAASWLESIDPDVLAPIVSDRFRSMTDDPIRLTLAVLIELAQEASGA